VGRGKDAFLRLIGGSIVIPALLILPAGTVAYWEAWLFSALLLSCLATLAIHLLANDPELLERRLQTTEPDPRQARIVALAGVCFLGLLVVPGFDRRFEWSQVPTTGVIIADLVVVAGVGLFAFVLRENRSASRVVEVRPGQRVVVTGPYAVVRHPMYVAVLLMGLATPMALGSWWALLPALLLIPVLVARIRNEERLLVAELAGYREYTHATPYRLIPGIW
jgi:protein-S-isoprenylcysteine O-methyltransferase Ste14